MGKTGRIALTSALVMLLAPGLARAETKAVRIPLEIASGESCLFDARGARLLDEVPAPDADGLIAIEAEQPVRHFCRPDLRHPGAPLPQDAECAGGGYLDAASYASYEFHATEAGDYWLWARVATPKGKSRFRDDVNGTIHYFFEEESEQPQPWHWVMRRKVRLRAGSNRLIVVAYGYSFPKIDRFVFAPSEAWQPEGLGPEVTMTPITEGWVATSPILIPGAKALVALEGLPGEAAALEYSTDDGQSWTELAFDAAARPRRSPLPSGEAGPLSGLPLSFRLKLAPGAQPDPGRLNLVAEVDTDHFVELADAQNRLVFDGRTGGLFIIENLATGEVVSCAGRSRPLVSVDFKRPGEAEWMRVGPESVTKLLAKEGRRPGLWVQEQQEPQRAELNPRSVEVDGNRLSVTYLFASEGLGRAEVTYVIEPGERGAWKWEVTVRALEGPADVVAVTFPIIEHVRLGPSGLDDIQFRMQSFGHQVIQPGKSTMRDASYCGQVSMAWTDVHDDRGGLYLGAHDPSATNVLFGSRSGGLDAEHFDMWTRKLDDIKPGEQTTYDYAVGAHPGRWHWGADRYREWFHQAFGRAEYPDWMRTCDGWLDLQAENYGKSFRFDQLPDWLTRARALGLDWTQVWGQFAYDGGPCCHDFPALSPLYGGAEGWQAAVTEIKRRGGHIGGYFVYDRLDRLPILADYFLGHFRKSEYPPDTPWVPADYFARMLLISDPAGVVPPWPPSDEQIAEHQAEIAEHQETYAKGERARPVIWWGKTCINDPEWWEYLRFWIVDKYVREWGCNACYIDVLGCGGAYESYDTRRAHNGDGGYGMGKLNIARTVIEDARRADADFAGTMEGLNDLPGLYCASMCSGVYRGARNVMRYTFPERILIHGTANPGSGGTSLDRYAETFLEGMRYDIVGRGSAGAVYLLSLQRSFTPWLYRARFMDTVGLSVSDPRLKARWLHKDSGDARGALLTLINREHLDDVTLTFDGSHVGGIKAAFYVGLSGAASALELERRDGRVAFTVPSEMAAQAFLVSEAEGSEAVWPVIHLVRHGDPHLAVTLFNLTDRPQSGVCRLENLSFTEPYQDHLDEAEAELPLAQNELPYSLQPHQVATLEFPVESLRRLYYTVRVRATLQPEQGQPISREFLVLPLAPDGSFEFTGDGTDRVTGGQRSLRLPPSDEGYQHRLVDLWLLPQRRYRVSVQAMRTGFEARVHSTAFALRGAEYEEPLRRATMDRDRPNEWQTLEYDFETPPDLTRAAIYLYNVGSPDTAWFDDLYVEDLGPVPPQ